MLQLPPPVPVDHGRAGLLTLPMADGFIAGLLGLPAGQTTSLAGCDLDRGVIYLRVEGAPMPPCVDGERPKQVTLLCFTHFADGWLTTYAAWSHAPDSKWFVNKRPYQPVG